jgi:predicted DNA-binding transcriptional regulator AlpA
LDSLATLKFCARAVVERFPLATIAPNRTSQKIGIGHNNPPESIPARRLYTVNEFSQAFRLSRPSIYKLLRGGELPSPVICGRRSTPYDAGEALLQHAPRHSALAAVPSARKPRAMTQQFPAVEPNRRTRRLATATWPTFIDIMPGRKGG